MGLKANEFQKNNNLLKLQPSFCYIYLKSSDVIMLTSHVYDVMLDRALKATFGVFPDAVGFF